MSIGSALFSYLSNKASITARVSTRIYPHPAPESATYPFITYSTTGEDHQHHMEGGSGLVDVSMQIDVWAETMANRVLTQEALRNALDGYTGGMGLESLNIRSCFLQDLTELHEPDTEGKGRPIYRASMDFSIWHVESVPTL